MKVYVSALHYTYSGTGLIIRLGCLEIGSGTDLQAEGLLGERYINTEGKQDWEERGFDLPGAAGETLINPW